MGRLFLRLPSREVSALHVLSFVAGFGNSVWAFYAAITNKFGKGTASLVEALAGDGGADIRLSSPVKRVEQGGDGGHGHDPGR